MSNIKVTAYISRDLKDKVVEEAKSEKRSESQQVAVVIEKHYDLLEKSRLLIAKSVAAIEGSKKMLGKGSDGN